MRLIIDVPALEVVIPRSAASNDQGGDGEHAPSGRVQALNQFFYFPCLNILLCFGTHPRRWQSLTIIVETEVKKRWAPPYSGRIYTIGPSLSTAPDTCRNR
jgi:hypothetical protein